MIPLARPVSLEELSAALGGAPGAQIVGSNSMGRAEAGEVPRISLLRFNKIVEHRPEACTLVVQAGMSLEAIQQALAWHNQWVPMDPPAAGGRTPGSRTIGGILATDSRGPLAMRHDWRQIALWGKWIDAGGAVCAGELAAAIGTRGATGVLAEITLRVSPRPADERVLIAYCDDTARAEAVRAGMRGRPEVAYLQILGGGTFATNPLGLPGGRWVVLIGTMGADAGDDLEAIRQQLEGVETIAQRAPQAGRLRLWMTSEPAGTVGFRAMCPKEAVAGILTRLEELECWAVGDAGFGQIRGAWMGAEGFAAVEEAVAAGDGQCERTWVRGKQGQSAPRP